MKVLLAGASGAVGFEALKILSQRACSVRTLSRSPHNEARLAAYADERRYADATRAAAIAGICDGATHVISCIGGSVLSPRDRRSFWTVDYEANMNLLAQARRAGVRRFVYIGVFPGDGYADTDYVRAHRAFEEALASSGLEYVVVRPTGVFSAIAAAVQGAARKGIGAVIGSGNNRTNPVHEYDVAEQATEALFDAQPGRIIDIGGPDVVSRRELFVLAGAVVGKTPRCLSLPPGLLLLLARCVRLFHPRMGELLTFFIKVGTHDCIAPARGTRQLRAYFEERAQNTDRAAPSRAAVS